MARKRKGKGEAAQSPMMGSGESLSTGIDQAENGFIVNVSGTSGKNGGYFSKRFVASSRPAAMRIAAHHMAGAAKSKGGKKKGKGRSLKKSA